MTISEIYKLYTQHYLVDTDTRNIRKNTIFFALKGENFNGNEFAEEALKKGASYAIVDEKKFQTNERIILVEDVLKCLQKLANYHRKKLSIPILSLTGSNGKTTTKELINVVLSKKFNTVATKGNLNNHIGVPLTLLSMDNKTEFGIIEMGANHKKEIAFLCTIAEPNYGYITNFGKAHLEGFGSIEGVIEGKTELYEFIKKTKGKVFVNPDDKTQIEKSSGIETIPFDSTINLIDTNPNVRLTFKKIDISSQLIGSYNYPNIAAAITIGHYFNIDKLVIKEAIENYVSTNNRSQIILKKGNNIILDAYNANPSSMKVAIQNLDSLNASHKVAILGDMFELGKNAIDEHQTIVNYIENTSIDNIITVGELFYTTKSKRTLQHPNFEAFKTGFDLNKLHNSTILIKGSRGMKLERILELF